MLSARCIFLESAMKNHILLTVFVMIAAAAAAFLTAPVQSTIATTTTALPTPVKRTSVKTVAEITYTEGEFDGTVITRSEAEWKKMLSPTSLLRSPKGRHRTGVYRCPDRQ